MDKRDDRPQDRRDSTSQQSNLLGRHDFRGGTFHNPLSWNLHAFLRSTQAYFSKYASE
jgi:hypothetical protein